jgi:hypothetical protein
MHGLRLAPVRAYGEGARIRGPVPRVPHRQPHSIRSLGGRPCLTFKLLPRRSSCSELAGRFAHTVKCARILRPVSSAPQSQPHLIRGPGGRPRLTFEFLLRWSTWSEPAGRFARIVNCAHLVPGEIGAATPPAFHPRPPVGVAHSICTRSPHFPRAGVPPRINRGRPPRGMGAGDLACAAVCALHAQPSHLPRRSMFAGGIGALRQLARPMRRFPDRPFGANFRIPDNPFPICRSRWTSSAKVSAPACSLPRRRGFKFGSRMSRRFGIYPKPAIVRNGRTVVFRLLMQCAFETTPRTSRCECGSPRRHLGPRANQRKWSTSIRSLPASLSI